MTASFYIYNHSRIHYYSFGKGPLLAFCFHGYGETGKVFQLLDEQAINTTTYIAIDLPHHGKTEWNEDSAITNKILWEILQGIAKQHIDWYSSEKIKLLGFSLGARIALNLYEAQPQHFEKLILLAPDGLKLNFWYWFATQTFIGSALFKLTIRHTSWFMVFLNILNKLKLINASIYKFTFHYLKDKKSRNELYQRWIGLRKFRPNLKEIKRQIVLHHTSIRLVYGKHDRIILPVRGEKFQKGIEPYCTITIIDSGHQVLQERNLNEIIEAIQN